MSNFEILRSYKTGLASPDSYVVTRSRTSFLRLLGRQPEWELMTATASEDTGSIRVCADQRRLVDAALRTCVESGNTQPKVKVDHFGREFVMICTVRQNPGEVDDLVKSQLNTVIARFFDFYDGYKPFIARSSDEMQILYDTLTTEDGKDVYLSDGVWLSSNGLLRDSGR